MNFIRKNTSLVYSVVLVLIFAFIYIYVFDKKLDFSGDNYNYLNFAKSILNGKGYSSPYTSEFLPTNWYPPGYSFLLAVVMFFFGNNIIVFKIINGLFFIGSILLLYQIVLKISKNHFFSFVISLLPLLSYGLLKYSYIIMSEMPYLFFTTLTIFFILKLEGVPNLLKSKYFYLLILSSVITYYFRSQAIVLIVSILVYFLLLKKNKIAVFYFLGFILLYIPWVIRNSIHGLKGRYLDTIMIFNPWDADTERIKSVSEFFEKVYDNLYNTVILGFFQIVFPFINRADINYDLLLIVFGIFIIIIVFLGALKTGKFRYFFTSYLIFNITVFLLWHIGNKSRYVWTLTPFIVFYFYYGLFNILKLFIKINKKRLLFAFSFLILLLSGFNYKTIINLHNINKIEYFFQGYQHYIDLAKEVNKLHYNNKYVIACRKPGMFYYYSGCYAVRYKFSNNEEAVLQDLVDKKVDYVLLEDLGLNSTEKFLIPVISKYNDLFYEHITVVDGNTFLLEFKRKDAEKILSGKIIN